MMRTMDKSLTVLGLNMKAEVQAVVASFPGRRAGEG
jgi:hypothetical protein